MKWKKSRQFLANDNKGTKSMSSVHMAHLPGAKDYADQFFKMKTRGTESKAAAIADIAKRSGMTTRSMERLLRGETKRPAEGIRDRIRAAYLDYCAKLVKRVLDEVEHDKKVHGDDALEGIGAEAEALLDKIQAAKERTAR